MRRISVILSLILLIATESQAQSGRSSVPGDNIDRIIKLYPNPATTDITFDLQKGYQKGMSVQIYSFLGKKVYEIPNAPQKSRVDLADFNRGLYMYHLLDATGKVVESGKFQVSK